MALRSEELEFISVTNEEDDDTMSNSYNTNASDSHGDSVYGNTILKHSKHPIILGFHMLFKSLALLIYVFGSWFSSNFIFNFVLCIIFLAFDFWTVKNVSGRLLVGLRWWSYVRDDGSNEWVFESLEDMAEVGAFDSKVFWGTLYGIPAAWIVLLFIGILRLQFEYLPVVLAGVFMNGANLMGYYKCSASAQGKMKTLLSKGSLTAAALNNSSVGSWLFSWIMSTIAPAPPAPRTSSETIV